MKVKNHKGAEGAQRKERWRTPIRAILKTVSVTPARPVTPALPKKGVSHPCVTNSSWLLYDRTELDLGMLTKGQKYYVRVDAFNENGITGGEVTEIIN